RFMKRLQQRDQYLQEAEERAAARTPANLPLTELEINKRYVQILIENGIETAGEFLSRLETDGEDKLVEIPGIGRKVIADIKKALRARGYNLPTPAAAE